MFARRFEWRTFGLIAGAALLGALWSAYNLRSAGASRDSEVFRALIWVVFATPFATFWGWIIARPGERWHAAFVCFSIYFFTIFLAARVERFVLGEAAAAAARHALYFRLTLLFDLLACLGVALQRARGAGTIPRQFEPITRAAPSPD